MGVRSLNTFNMDKEKLIELSKQYFDNNKDLNEIIACSDGNFFYTDADASYHFAKNDVEKHVISRVDAYPPKVEKPKVVKKVVKKEVPKNDK